MNVSPSSSSSSGPSHENFPLRAKVIEEARAIHALGSEVIVLERCATTQAEAQALAQKGAPHGTLVLARKQTQGRGRRGRSWMSEEGGLYFSLLLRPDVAVEKLPRMPLLTAAGILEGLRALSVDARVKWPNDILLPARGEGPLGPFRKVSGILAEPALRDGHIEAVILGIGLNLRRPKAGFPEELSDLAGALEDVGVTAGPEEVLLALLDPLERWLTDVEDDATFAACLSFLKERSALLGRRVNVPEEGFSGIAEEIDPDGALVVRSDDGTFHRVIAGDVLPSR